MVCRAVFGVLVLAYVAALAAFLAVSYGWLGDAVDPYSGVFLVLMGLPWVLVRSLVAPTIGPSAYFIAATVAPLINLLIVWLICRRSRRRELDYLA